MDKAESNFIKKLALRFFHVYPISQGRWNIDALCLYLTNMCPALCYVGFYKDLEDAIQSLVSERSLFTIAASDVTNEKNFVFYELTDSGRANADLINDFTIINTVLDVWIKDIKFRNWVIRRFLPFQRFSEFDLSERVREVLYLDNYNNDSIKAARYAIIYDHNSFDRLFDFLKKGGFIREYQKDMFKFTKRGRVLIEVGNYEEYVEQEEADKKRDKDREATNDLLAASNLANAQIQQSLLQTNRWIALAGIAAAAYYLLEIHLELKSKKAEFYELIFPYLITFEATLAMVGISIGIWHILKSLQEGGKHK